ncbi:uncharacterized mitochondrial protein AtMg00810-like [Gossypium hirsutum]|uniref:Uncharacterized mitochondrial protein AtMg00810-like n=1 Tax=Gossypium hirsutum TaxID=3635 RepID=A0ABM3BJA3_GOSHI|nr:uncharacterized mitochondrial protein AtMg00810-like [Gossypium hirsutum]
MVGSQRLLIDASLFVQSSSDYTLYVLVYVDDIVITGSSSDEINCFVQQLHNKFALKDIGDLHYFLGIKVSRSSFDNLHLRQHKYIREILDRSSMSNAKSVHTPMVSSSMLTKDEGEHLADPTDYRSLAGALQYIVLTWPDIAYVVNQVCQFMHAPITSHMVALKRILRYLRGTFSHGLIFQISDRLSLVGYADANWGLDFDDCRSTTGYLWCDNSSAVAIAANLVLHFKFKHVELDLFFVREKVASGELVVGAVAACDQVADIFTKPLSVSMFTQFHHLLRIVPLEEAGKPTTTLLPVGLSKGTVWKGLHQGNQITLRYLQALETLTNSPKRKADTYMHVDEKYDRHRKCEAETSGIARLQ